MFWISWSQSARKTPQGQGFFNCPTCARRQPCQMSQYVRRSYLYGIIPLTAGEPVGQEFYFCIACRREFQSDGRAAYDFGSESGPRTWKCFKCGAEIEYHRFDCPSCGCQFDFGQNRD
jgi:hypothetical protein